MIVYTGWADPNIAPMWSMQHVEAVIQGTLGVETSIAENGFIKLVMIPGGGHCGSNIAKYPHVPANYDVSTAMVEWVERKKDLREGVRSWGPTNGGNITRRLCTWPLVAKLVGEDSDDWQNYVCG
jgi:feruloyl esterase